jgi:hypothetical protein
MLMLAKVSGNKVIIINAPQHFDEHKSHGKIVPHQR